MLSLEVSFRVTPKELQFRNPLDARDDMRRKLRDRKHHHHYFCLF